MDYGLKDLYEKIPSRLMDDATAEVFRTQLAGYGRQLDDYVEKFFWYVAPPADPDSRKALKFDDFAHCLQSIRANPRFSSVHRNFPLVFLAHWFYEHGANCDGLLTPLEISTIFPKTQTLNKDNNPMNLAMQSFRVGNGLFVNEYEVVQTATSDTKAVKQPINHIFCCDISGSMWGSLGRMRTQLKNRLVDIIDEQDTITIIAFADGDDCFVLKEKVHCTNPSELADLHKAIDRYLQPMGCTDFLEPTKKSIDIVKDGGYYNWVFLSDGGHNCGPFTSVVDALEKLSPSCAQATIIEYGYYADSNRLSQMAEIMGGTKIPAADFEHYTPIIESSFTGGSCVKKIEVELPFNAKAKLTHQFVVYVNPTTGNAHVAAIDADNKVQLPTDVTKFYTTSRATVGTLSNGKPSDDKAFYGVAYVLADKLDYDAVEDILNAIGDTKFVEMYQTSFGKQKLFAFQNELGKAINDKSARGKIDPNFKPNLDPYCVIDAFNDIADDEDNLIRVCSSEFEYNRTGAKTEDKVSLTDEEQERLKNAKTTAEAQAILKEAEKRQVQVKRIDRGYPISNFVWNEERANLGGLFQIDVELTLPDNKFGLKTIPSTIFRNFVIIKDGIINMPVIPMILTRNTYAKLLKHPSVVLTDVSEESKDGMRYVTVDLSKLPVVNKKKIKGAKKSVMTNAALQLTDCKFTLNYLKKQLPEEPATTTAFAQYTAEQAEYLATLGITEKGYNPPKTTVKGGDFYMATCLNSTFKGFTKIPSKADLDAKVQKNKPFTPAEQYIDGVIKRVEDYIKKVGGDRIATVKAMIEQVTAEKNQHQRDLAQMKFAMLVARKWFEGSDSFDDNLDTVHSKYGVDLNIEYSYSDKKVNL